MCDYNINTHAHTNNRGLTARDLSKFIFWQSATKIKKKKKNRYSSRRLVSKTG